MQKNYFGPIFGCKVVRSVPIGMKIDLESVALATRCMYQIDIEKNMLRKNSTESLKNPKCAKIIIKMSKIGFLQKTELVSRSIQWATYVPNLNDLSRFTRP